MMVMKKQLEDYKMKEQKIVFFVADKALVDEIDKLKSEASFWDETIITEDMSPSFVMKQIGKLFSKKRSNWVRGLWGKSEVKVKVNVDSKTEEAKKELKRIQNKKSQEKKKIKKIEIKGS